MHLFVVNYNKHSYFKLANISCIHVYISIQHNKIYIIHDVSNTCIELIVIYIFKKVFFFRNKYILIIFYIFKISFNGRLIRCLSCPKSNIQAGHYYLKLSNMLLNKCSFKFYSNYDCKKLIQNRLNVSVE